MSLAMLDFSSARIALGALAIQDSTLLQSHLTLTPFGSAAPMNLSLPLLTEPTGLFITAHQVLVQYSFGIEFSAKFGYAYGTGGTVLFTNDGGDHLGDEAFRI